MAVCTCLGVRETRGEFQDLFAQMTRRLFAFPDPWRLAHPMVSLLLSLTHKALLHVSDPIVAYSSYGVSASLSDP